MEQLMDIVKRMANGTAPGPSGMSGDVIKALCEDEAIFAAVGDIVLHIINGQLSGDAAIAVLQGKLIGIVKNDGGIRPICISEVIPKFASAYAMALGGEAIPRVFDCSDIRRSDIQLGVGTSGG